jgi:hypothetical protein
LTIGGADASVRLTGTPNVWLSGYPSEPQVTVNNQHIVRTQKGKDALHPVVSADPRWAHFGPKTLNTLPAPLRRSEKPSPREEIPRPPDRQKARHG